MTLLSNCCHNNSSQSKEDDELTVSSVNLKTVENTLAHTDLCPAKPCLRLSSPTNCRKYLENSEVVEESDCETIQRSTSLMQVDEVIGQDGNDTSYCIHASASKTELITSSLKSLRKTKISRFKRSVQDEFEEHAYDTPSRKSVGDCLSEIITPYSEMTFASPEATTPKTMPKSMRKDSRPSLGDAKNGTSSGCWCSAPAFNSCPNRFHEGTLDCELPMSYETNVEHAIDVQYLIPPLSNTSTTSPSPNSRVFEDNPGFPILTLVLDLDETLIFNRQPSGKNNNAPTLRPFLIPFLLSLPHHLVEVVVWTASTSATARHVIRYILAKVKQLLESGHKKSLENVTIPKETNEARVPIIDHVISRNSFWFLSPYPEGTESVEIPRPPISYHTKDLRLLGRNLDSVLLVENSHHCCKLQPKSSVIVKDFHGFARSSLCTPSAQHEFREPSVDDLIKEDLCFQSLVLSYEDLSTKNQASRQCGEHCMKPLHEHLQDMTLVGLAVLIRETVRRLCQKTGSATVPNILQELSDEAFPLKATSNRRMSGNEAFFMNFLGMETFPFSETDKVGETYEKQYFQSLNARINSPISGTFFHVQKDLFEEPHGRYTV
ncbi:TFIIF-stimulated CTD phosphatase [Perkinsela sp. CCAP 1560/4]|nr:TFIIF-stimulated CTD phosphatase [Perkinsela sp. CCAP 1560/4]|eukprot:KNH00547.1 TFIIF-stimulated CTD phosphatase [Perkinsela sp. CCAP 1560/4]